MNNEIRSLPTGGFEVVYTQAQPCPGQVQVLVGETTDGQPIWATRQPYEPYAAQQEDLVCGSCGAGFKGNRGDKCPACGAPTQIRCS